MLPVTKQQRRTPKEFVLFSQTSLQCSENENIMLEIEWICLDVMSYSPYLHLKPIFNYIPQGFPWRLNRPFSDSHRFLRSMTSALTTDCQQREFQLPITLQTEVESRNCIYTFRVSRTIPSNEGESVISCMVSWLQSNWAQVVLVNSV